MDTTVLFGLAAFVFAFAILLGVVWAMRVREHGNDELRASAAHRRTTEQLDLRAKQFQAEDTVPQRIRNQDKYENVRDYVFGMTNDMNYAKALAAMASETERNGGKVELGMDEITYHVDNSTRRIYTFSKWRR